MNDPALLELLAQIMGLKAKDLDQFDPDDLELALQTVGLQTEQVGGMRVLKLGGHLGQTQARQPTMDHYLDQMNATQLKAVGTRFGLEATRMEEIKKGVIKALNSPEKIKAMLDELSDLERFLLAQVKAEGGSISGWELVMRAATVGFAPPLRISSDAFYRNQLSERAGATYLGHLLRDGLLLPHSLQNSWFQTYYAYRGTAQDDRVWTDPRILKQVADYVVPSVVPLKLEATSANPTALNPIRWVLELAEAFNLVAEEGRLQLTKEGGLSKVQLNRLQKRRPWLEDRLELHLGILVGLGLFDSPKGDLAPQLGQWHQLLQAPMPVLYSALVMAYCQMPGEYSAEIPDLAVARQALLSGLMLLPEHPVALPTALDRLWNRLLRFVAERRVMWAWEEGKRVQREQPIPVWFAQTLKHSFYPIGLLALDEAKNAIGPGPGLGWLREAGRLDPGKLPPPEKCFLVQPNFEILVYLDRLSGPALLALSAADCTRTDPQTASYTLSRGSVYRALEGGLSLERLTELLATLSQNPLPANVAASLREWSQRRERLSLLSGATLFEYASPQERDAAQRQYSQAQPVGERFLLWPLGKPLPALKPAPTYYRYDQPPQPSVQFKPDGSFRFEKSTDLALRAVLDSVAVADDSGGYQLSQAAIAAGQFAGSNREAFLARVRGGLPPVLDALIGTWEGKSVAALAPVTLFQHPSAIALAQHPELAPLLGAALSPTAIAVKSGQEAAFRKALQALNIQPTQSLQAKVEAKAPSDALQTGLNTRKVREMIEGAIAGKRDLELRYHREKEIHNSWGYHAKTTKGKLLHEKIKPLEVTYSGSTPYMDGKTLDKGERRSIRIGYIVAIGLI